MLGMLHSFSFVGEETSQPKAQRFDESPVAVCGQNHVAWSLRLFSAVVLFWKVVGPLGHGFLLEETGHWEFAVILDSLTPGPALSRRKVKNV